MYWNFDFVILLYVIKYLNVVGHEINPDIYLSLKELTNKYGYPLELHSNIVTPDGYNLSMDRIPYGKYSTVSGPRRPIILLMHGIAANGETWTIGGPKFGLGYILADKGYDVWIGRARGTEFSRGHKHYNAETDDEYWMFSWHEMGYYDLPTMIDHILSETGQNNLTYVAHSQGTTLFFVMASTRPEYNDKVNLFVAFAPAVYLSNTKLPFARLFTANYGLVEDIVHIFHIYDIFPYRRFLWRFMSVFCSQNIFFESISAVLFLFLPGYDFESLNWPLMCMMVSRLPDDISAIQLLHFLQSIESGQFRQYNHGPEENLKRYGQIEPPKYNLSKVETPVIIFYGKEDPVISEKDVNILSKELPNLLRRHLIPYKKFGHLDYFLGKNVNTLVHNMLLNLLNTYIL